MFFTLPQLPKLNRSYFFTWHSLVQRKFIHKQDCHWFHSNDYVQGIHDATGIVQHWGGSVQLRVINAKCGLIKIIMLFKENIFCHIINSSLCHGKTQNKWAFVELAYSSLFYCCPGTFKSVRNDVNGDSPLISAECVETQNTLT